MSRTTRAMFIGAVSVAASLSTAVTAAASPGDLDATFSGDGARHVAGDFAVDVGVQSTGNVIVLGTRVVEPDSTIATVTRLRPSGAIDTTFGTNGTLVYDVDGAAVQPMAMVVQPDNGIVVVGSSGDGDAVQMTVTRVTASGAIDTSFGIDGHRTIVRGNNSQLTDVALDANNRIVASGWVNNGTANNPLIVRLTKSGNRDATFDGNGVQTLPHPDSSVAYGSEIEITTAGRIVMAMEVVKAGGVIETSIMRVRANAAVDTSFGQNGYRRITIAGAVRTQPRGLEIDPAGRTVVLVNSTSELDATQAAVAVLTPSGTLDPTFGSDGRRVVPLIGGIAVWDGSFGDIEVQADGKILVGASIWAEGGFEDSLVLRLKSNGRVDRSFSGDGAVVFDPLWEGASRLAALALSPTNGRVYAAGYVIDYMSFEGTTPGVVAIRTR